MTHSIEVTGLTKRYADTVAVDDVSFSVPQGTVFAFLGTNGAGKSTTIACLTTVERPDAGRLLVGGHDVTAHGDAARRAIGVVFQDSLLDDSLTVRENLTVRAQPYINNRKGIMHRIDQLAEAMQLDEILDRRYGKLSGGQRRRVDIARAIIHDPQVLFLDEPTTGLDPAARPPNDVGHHPAAAQSNRIDDLPHNSLHGRDRGSRPGRDHRSRPPHCRRNPSPTTSTTQLEHPQPHYSRRYRASPRRRRSPGPPDPHRTGRLPSRFRVSTRADG